MGAPVVGFIRVQGLQTVRYLTSQTQHLRGVASKSSIKWKDSFAFLFLPQPGLQAGHFYRICWS
jgi:hypothetical protein